MSTRNRKAMLKMSVALPSSVVTETPAEDGGNFKVTTIDDAVLVAATLGQQNADGVDSWPRLFEKTMIWSRDGIVDPKSNEHINKLINGFNSTAKDSWAVRTVENKRTEIRRAAKLGRVKGIDHAGIILKTRETLGKIKEGGKRIQQTLNAFNAIAVKQLDKVDEKTGKVTRLTADDYMSACAYTSGEETTVLDVVTAARNRIGAMTGQYKSKAKGKKSALKTQSQYVKEAFKALDAAVNALSGKSNGNGNGNGSGGK